MKGRKEQIMNLREQFCIEYQEKLDKTSLSFKDMNDEIKDLISKMVKLSEESKIPFELNINLGNDSIKQTYLPRSFSSWVSSVQKDDRKSDSRLSKITKFESFFIDFCASSGISSVVIRTLSNQSGWINLDSTQENEDEDEDDDNGWTPSQKCW